MRRARLCAFARHTTIKLYLLPVRELFLYRDWPNIPEDQQGTANTHS
jgi:hypothetical protein